MSPNAGVTAANPKNSHASSSGALDRLNDLMVVSTRAESPLSANAPADASGSQVSNFVTVQSLGTFAVAVPVVKAMWELLKTVTGGWTHSYWTPFVLCLLFGFWQFSLSVWSDSPPKGVMPKVSAGVIAAANASVLAAAVIGLTQTVR